MANGYYSKDEIRQARQTNIVVYLESVNEAARSAGEIEPYRMTREGNEYRVEGYGGLLVNNNYWSVQSEKTLVGEKMVTQGGNTLDFLTKFEGKSFSEAMGVLIGKDLQRQSVERPREYTPKSDKSNFMLPEKFENSRRAIAYLTKTRFIHPEVVINEVKNGNIYEDKDHHNAIFVGRSPDGEPRWANKRSTLTDSSFKGDAHASDPRYPFVLRNDQNRNDGYLIATESPIEAMSYATIMKIQGAQTIKNDIMGIGGAHGVGILQYLKDHPQTKGVILALNNDRQGRESTELIENELKAHGYLGRKGFEFRSITPRDAEDWNEYLIKLIKQMEQQKKLNEERGIVGEVQIKLQQGEVSQIFFISKDKIIRNGSENIVLYGPKNIATLNTKTMTFGISERGNQIKDTYFVKKVQIDPNVKLRVIETVNKAIEADLQKITQPKTLDATGKLTNEELLSKDPKQLSVEEQIRVYKLRKQQRSRQEKSNPLPAKTPVRERAQIR